MAHGYMEILVEHAFIYPLQRHRNINMYCERRTIPSTPARPPRSLIESRSTSTCRVCPTFEQHVDVQKGRTDLDSSDHWAQVETRESDDLPVSTGLMICLNLDAPAYKADAAYWSDSKTIRERIALYDGRALEAHWHCDHCKAPSTLVGAARKNYDGSGWISLFLPRTHRHVELKSQDHAQVLGAIDEQDPVAAVSSPGVQASAWAFSESSRLVQSISSRLIFGRCAEPTHGGNGFGRTNMISLLSFTVI
ncbi:hypothetical protein PLICRDRAFT_26162 [Plicaturopsis crispa FD-325 SS-3]|nr:hypothetical protein PLICRDRAFT_26162 [Plicaturopsis crispa FD-325 SS-3]